MVYKVPPGDIFANNYGREHMKSSNQVRSDIQLPLSYENLNLNLKTIENKLLEYLDAASYPQSVVMEDNASCIPSPNRHVGNKCCFFRGQAVALINMTENTHSKSSTDDDSVSNEATSGSI